MRITMLLLLVLFCIAFGASAAVAGMPGALPEDIDTILRLSGPADARLQSISFFVAGICVASVVVKLLWNAIAKDSGWLPRLSWTKAVVLLWGSLFVLVLTMISGARELLTPGAWKKDGITYVLEDEQ